MEFKEYMKRSFLEHIEHLAEYNLEDEEFFHMMQSYISHLAEQEAFSKTREIMGYADYLMYDYADEHKKEDGITLQAGESITVGIVKDHPVDAFEAEVINYKNGEISLPFITKMAEQFTKNSGFNFTEYLHFRFIGLTKEQALEEMRKVE